MDDALKTIKNFHKMMKLVRRFPIRHSQKNQNLHHMLIQKNIIIIKKELCK
jgi:hypothetical protein